VLELGDNTFECHRHATTEPDFSQRLCPRLTVWKEKGKSKIVSKIVMGVRTRIESSFDNATNGASSYFETLVVAYLGGGATLSQTGGDPRIEGLILLEPVQNLAHAEVAKRSSVKRREESRERVRDLVVQRSTGGRKRNSRRVAATGITLWISA